MNVIRSWLERCKIQPASFNSVFNARRDVRFEIGFNSEDEAHVFEREFNFARMLEAEIPRLRRYARALTRDVIRADDLVQDGLTRALAVDLGPEGITVNCICQGPIRTGLTASIAEEHKEIFAKRRTALKRYGFPEEVAHITFSLCLPAASYITGEVIPVDGGLMIRNA